MSRTDGRTFAKYRGSDKGRRVSMQALQSYYAGAGLLWRGNLYK